MQAFFCFKSGEKRMLDGQPSSKIDQNIVTHEECVAMLINCKWRCFIKGTLLFCYLISVYSYLSQSCTRIIIKTCQFLVCCIFTHCTDDHIKVYPPVYFLTLIDHCDRCEIHIHNENHGLGLKILINNIYIFFLISFLSKSLFYSFYICSILVINKKKKIETITVNQYLSLRGKFNHCPNGRENLGNAY